MHGYHGRYLRLDLTSGVADLRPLPEVVLRSFLGGVGLATWLVARESPAGADPLGPEAALVFALSPLVGTPLTTSAKFAVAAISPLTGRLCDALSSSHFAIAAKRVGVDAIVLTGTAPALSVAFVDGLGREEPSVRIEPGGDLAGLSADEAERRIRAEAGAGWQIAAIGPAGERLVPFATLSHDGRHAGRGGLGAVLGARGLKAIAVRGDHRTTLADPGMVVERAKELSRRSLGPATAKYRELGTVANLLLFNRLEALPTRNFGTGSFASAGELAGFELEPDRRVARRSCASCTIGCEHLFADRNGKGVRLEYETLFALGPLCGIGDPGAVLEAAQACDAQGLDTISTGGTLAFAMDCTEAGILEPLELPSGRRLRFGDGAAVLEAIGCVARRDGVGALLSLGSRRAAEQIGGEAPQRAMHVKGLEMPGYDPRSLQTMALGLAVGTRGADHNRSGAYEADFSGDADRRHGDERSATLAIASEDRAALIDSFILCKFLRHVFDDLEEEAADLLGAVTGWEIGAAELRTTARRIVTARKCVNEREGWTCAEDTLPSRLLSEGSRGAAGGAGPVDRWEAGNGLPRERLERMVQAYYRERGWDPEGRVPRALRLEFGLDDGDFGRAFEART